MLWEGLRVPRHVGLRLASAIKRIGGTAHRPLSIVTLVKSTPARPLCFVLPALEVGIVLAELLLRRGDHAIIVLGVLIVVLRRNRITGSQRVPRKLDIFFRNVGWIAANFHIRTIGFVYPDHRIVTLAVVVAPAHPFILTVSHALPIAKPFIVAARCRRAFTKRLHSSASGANDRVLARLARRHKRQHSPQCHVSCREAATPCPRRAAALPSSSS